MESCAADDRIAALFLGGSRARGEDDEYSDIDLCVIVRDDAYDDVIAGRDALVRTLGEPLFLEDFGNGNMAFVILADGTELEFHFFRQATCDAIRSGPHRVLLDKDGILATGRSRCPRPTGRLRSRRSARSCSGSGMTSATSPRRSDAASSGGPPGSSSSSARTA